MINQQLIDFIKSQLQKGFSKEIITKELLANEWTAQDVEEGFKAVDVPIINLNNTPIPPSFNNINLSTSSIQTKNHSGLKIFLIIIMIFIFAGGASAYYFRDNLKKISFINNFFPKKESLVLDNLTDATNIINVNTSDTQTTPNNELIDNSIVESKNEPIIETKKITEKQVIFQAKLSTVAMNNAFLSKGKELTDFVEVKLPGEMYNTGKEFTVVGKNLAKYDTPINAVIADFSAFKVMDKDWIVENFVKEEQNNQRLLLNNKDSYEKIKKHYEKITKISITGEVELNNYKIVFVRLIEPDYTYLASPMVFTKTMNGWKKTNALSNDEDMSIIFAALSTGTVTEVK